jgi:hypothetical protein
LKKPNIWLCDSLTTTTARSSVSNAAKYQQRI